MNTEVMINKESKFFDVIRYPLLTEKSDAISNLGKNKKYSFEVDGKASKLYIKNAVESIFKVKVLSVNTMKYKSRVIKVKGRYGKTCSWKKAIVTLHDGFDISLFAGVQ